MAQKHILAARAVAWSNADVIRWQRRVVTSAGGDPGLVPDEPFAFWRLPEVERRVGLKRSSIYRKVAEGVFPPPVRLDVNTSALAGEPAAA